VRPCAKHHTTFTTTTTRAPFAINSAVGTLAQHRSITVIAMRCELHTYHRPVPHGLHRHHVIPLTWTKTLGLPASRVVLMCGTGHENLHRDLRAALRGQSYRAGGRSAELINEAVDFYDEHPEAQGTLWTLADQLVKEDA